MALSREQLEIRKQGVTGSEIAAVAGLSKWGSPIEIWQRKLGLIPEIETTPAMDRGNFLEAGMREWLAKDTGLVIDESSTLVHRDHPLVIATPDGIAYDNGQAVAAVELKSPGPRTCGDWEDPSERQDGIPTYYMPQVIWEMAVLGLDQCIVGALIWGELRIYRVPFSQDLFDVLLERAKEFWGFVERKEAPPVDGSEAADAMINGMFPAHKTGEIVRSTPDIDAAAGELRRVTAEMKTLKQESDVLKQTIKMHIGDNDGVATAAGKISWRKGKDRTHTAWGDFQDSMLNERSKYDDALALLGNYTTTRPGARVFRPTWKKG